MSILTEEEPTGINRDYGRRQYVDADPTDTYVDSMRRVTDKAMFNQALGKQSELKKPYQAESYEEMEHFYEKAGAREPSPVTPLILPPSPTFDIGTADPPILPPLVIPDIVTPVVVPDLPVVIPPIVVPTIEPPLEPWPGIDVGIIGPPIVVTREGIDDVVIVVTEPDAILEETIVPVIIRPDVIPTVVVIPTPILTDITLPVPEEPDPPPDTPPEPPFDVTGEPLVVPKPPRDAVIRTSMSLTFPITASAGTTIIGTGIIDSWLVAGFWDWEVSSPTSGITIAVRGLEVRGTRVEITVEIDSGVLTQDISIVATAKNTISTERPSAIASVGVTGRIATERGSLVSTTDTATTGESQDWNRGIGPFTIEFWLKPNFDFGSVEQIHYVGQYDDGDNYFSIKFTVDDDTITELDITHVLSGVTEFSYAGTVSIGNGTWVHLAFIRGWGGDANAFAITVNGTAISISGSQQSIPEVGNLAGDFVLLASEMPDLFPSAELYAGKSAEFRYSDVTRWTSNFTPETALYQLDANTLSILHFEGTTGSGDIIDFTERHIWVGDTPTIDAADSPFN